MQSIEKNVTDDLPECNKELRTMCKGGNFNLLDFHGKFDRL